MIAHIAGALIAFSTAILVVYTDGYQSIRKKLFEVPKLFWTSIPFALLAMMCGTLAILAYVSSLISADGADWTATVLGSRIENAYLRGFYIGLAVLTIIRSKLLQVRGADIGLEYIYGEFRIKCLGSVLSRWVDYRDGFIIANLNGMFKIDSIDSELRDLVQAAVGFADAEYKASVDSQLSAIFRDRPQGLPDPTSGDWRIFYRALMNITLENCGPDALTRKGLQRI